MVVGMGNQSALVFVVQYYRWKSHSSITSIFMFNLNLKAHDAISACTDSNILSSTLGVRANLGPSANNDSSSLLSCTCRDVTLSPGHSRIWEDCETSGSAGFDFGQEFVVLVEGDSFNRHSNLD